MNEELLHLYRNITPTQKTALQTVFADSPKTLLLVSVLEATEGDDFKTTKAVNIIYSEERKEITYSILVNRFYKLRQALKEWLLEQLQTNESYFTDEEQTLGLARWLVLQNEFSAAMLHLEQLETQCREHEIYELLPAVLQLLLRCVQSIEYTNTTLQEHYEDKLLEAIEYQRHLQQLQYHYRRSFRVWQHLQTSLQEIKRIQERHKTSVRFAKIYHYAAFLRGASALHTHPLPNNALSRHLNHFLQLQTQHPLVPVIYYELNHRDKIQFDLEAARALYAFSRGDWQAALQAVEQRKQLRRQCRHLYAHQSESEYRNDTTVYILNQQFDKALQTVEALFEFYEQNSPEGHQYLGYLELTNIYIFAYPQGKVLCPHPQQHLQQLNKALEVFNRPDSAILRGMLGAAKSLFLIILDEYVACLQLCEEPYILDTFRMYQVPVACIREYCQLRLQAASAAAWAAYQSKLKAQMKQPIVPVAKVYYQWLLQMTAIG